MDGCGLEDAVGSLCGWTLMPPVRGWTGTIMSFAD